MRIVALMSIVLFVILGPQISAAQSSPTTIKIFCPQCGFENKITARFCPQCGSSLPKPTSMSSNLSSASQSLAISASQSDSMAFARHEFIRALVADSEFNRLLQQRIHNAISEAATVQSTTPPAKPKANPIGSFFALIGGLTCSLLLFGLAVSL